MTFKKVFNSQYGHTLLKTTKFLIFSDQQGQFIQNFAKKPYIFLFLELFSPLKLPLPNSETKNELKGNFFSDTLYTLHTL